MGRTLVMGRRAGLAVVLSVLLSGGLAPAAAQLALYEDWSAERIEPERWRVLPLGASSSVYEMMRLVAGGQLHQLLRVYGGTQDDLGRQVGNNALAFVQSRFTAVQWDMAVHNYFLQGCPIPGAQPSELHVDLQMRLFNDGSSQGSGDMTGHVDTHLRLVRRSDSIDPPERVQAIGLVTRCNVPDCSTRDVLGERGLGQVGLGEMNTFLMFWDAFNSGILFRRISVTEAVDEFIVYSVPVVTRLPGRAWQVVGIGANCTATPRPVAEGYATFDNIFVFGP